MIKRRAARGKRTSKRRKSRLALLREVAGKDISGSYDRTWQDARTALLAEVRRVVADVRDSMRPPGVPLGSRAVCDEILRRLEGLK